MVKKQKTQKPEKVEEVKPVEFNEELGEIEVKTEEPVEVKPQFKNNTKKGIKIKLVEGKNFKWITVKTGESVTIPRKIALRNGLFEVK